MSSEKRDQLLFDQVAESYAKKDRVLSSALARESQLLSVVKPLLDEVPSLGTIVEIGCGVGAPAKYLAGYYDHYLGIDHSEEMIKAAMLFNQGNPRVEFIASNIKSRELPRDTADVVLSIGALHHMTQLERVLGSLIRIAKPRAYLVAVEPQNGNPVIQAMRYVRGIVDSAYSRQQVFFSESELKALFERMGITVVSVAFQGFLTPPFAQVVIQPQVLSVPVSRFAVLADLWLDTHLPTPLKKLSFNIVMVGRFDG
jgi:ubiquinone/menaquinone biosynthesis C-methylase UbiE